MKILITGGAGFIGSHLAERLLNDGHQVWAMDDLSTGQMSNLEVASKHKNFEFIKGTILDQALVQDLVDKTDLTFHLAAAVGVKLIMEQPSQSILTNITGTENVLKAALKDKKTVFVASTSEVYGKTSKIPFCEDDDLVIGATVNLRWSYACTKTLDEFLALSYAYEQQLPVVVLRFFNTTGPRQTGRYGMVAPNFIRSALAGEPIFVHGTGDQSRCFSHVRDVVESLVRLMDNQDARGKVFNIGSDQEISIMQLAEKVKELTGSSSEIKRIPYTDVYPHGFEDMQRRKPDVSKLRAAVDFAPKTKLEDIINDIVAEKREIVGA